MTTSATTHTNANGNAMALNSHFSSTGNPVAISAPGFALSSHASSTHSSMGSSLNLLLTSTPAASGGGGSGMCGSAPVMYLRNHSTSYQSHFGDVGAGAVGIMAKPHRSAPGTPTHHPISVSPALPSRVSSSSLTGTPVATAGTFAGSPPPVMGCGVIGGDHRITRGAPLSGTGGPPPVGLMIAPLGKFAVPSSMPVGAVGPTATASPASSGAAHGGRGDDDEVGCVSPNTIRSTSPSLEGVGAPLKELCTTSNSSSSSSSMHVSLAHPSAPPPFGVPGTCEPRAGLSPLLFESDLDVSVGIDTVVSMARALHEQEGTKSNCYTVQSFSEPHSDLDTGAAPHSPTSSGSVAGAHSRSYSLTSSVNPNPQMDGMMLAPTPPMPPGNLSSHQRSGSLGAYTPVAQLTPVSARSSGSFGSSSGGPAGQEPVVNVYDFDFKTLLTLPATQILHRPHPSLGVSRLVLCRNFTLENPGNCTKGELCKFVHADIRNASRCSIHVNYAWRSLALCTYPRLPAGDQLTVLAPNERPPSETLPSERILVTRGSLSWGEHNAPLSHCAHYYFNRMCNRGERCNFIHAVHVDPNVQGDFKRAPAPTVVAPVVPKSPTSPGMRRVSPTGVEGRSPSSHRGGAAARSPCVTRQPPPPPPPLPPPQLIPCNTSGGGGGLMPGGVAYTFVPNNLFGTSPPACMGYPLMPQQPVSSPTTLGDPRSPLTTTTAGASTPYMMVMNGGAPPPGCTYFPTTLMSPSTQLGSANGVFVFLPTTSGAAPGSATGSPGTPLGSASWDTEQQRPC